jgi:Tfp pilus assembly protein PilF
MGIKRAKILMEAGDVDGARQELLELVDIDPSSEGAWLLLVGIGYRTNDATLSLRAFRELKKTRSRDAYVASGLVDCLIQLERYEEAKQEIQRFSEVAEPGLPVHDTVLEEHRRALEFIRGRLSESDQGDASAP